MMRRIRPGYPAVMAAYISKLQILLAEPLATWLRPTLGQRRWNYSEIEPNGNTDASRPRSQLDRITTVKILPTHVAESCGWNNSRMVGNSETGDKRASKDINPLKPARHHVS